MTAVISDVSLKDLDRLYDIETECFEKEAFTKTQIAELLKDYNSIGLVARVDGQIVGFVIGTIYVDGKVLQAHICTIEVLPSFRRRGIGEELLEEVEKIFRQQRVKTSALEVREDNAAAIGLYRKLGYNTVGRLKHYYGTRHGLYLRKTLA
jgi:[ribosomal protein S18]-alanine N-acetyltransferase